jgi:hypothetical protein
MRGFVFSLMVAVVMGCAPDSLHGNYGTGGWTQSGGAPGSGGSTQSGGAPGSGGQTGRAKDASAAGGSPAFDSGGSETLPGYLAAAAAEWAAVKPSCPTYQYSSVRMSASGVCVTTTIEIANDQPIGRSFSVGAGDCVGAPILDAGAPEQWSEVGAAQVGSHADGDPARTAEQIFAYCQTVVDAAPSEDVTYLGIGADGIPTECEALPNGCGTNCAYSGLQIKGFTCEPSPNAGGDASSP